MINILIWVLIWLLYMGVAWLYGKKRYLEGFRDGSKKEMKYWQNGQWMAKTQFILLKWQDKNNN